MQKLLLKSLLFFVIIIGLITYTSLFIPKSDPDSYLAILNDKHRIADSIKTPKLILVGGSNLGFGLNSKILRKEIGIPTANLGLHAGLGLDFMLNQAKFVAKENDIILLSIEYQLDLIGNYNLKRHTSDVYSYAHLFYEQSFYLDFEDNLSDSRRAYEDYVNTKFNFAKKILRQILGKPLKIPISTIQASKANPYSRKAINSDADVVAHLEEPFMGILARDALMNYRYWKGIARINEFASEMKKKNVTVFFVFPNYPQKDYVVNKQVILLLEKDLRANLTVGILGSPAYFLYPDDHFYDTLYHLNKIGHKKRTEDLAALIKNTPAMLKAIERIRRL